MAERRMFTKKITESDAFLDMPLTTQALYFHLNMAADDEGFVNNPKKIQRMIGATEDDLKLLIMKSFILTFESGVIVVKHWKMHNYIQNDRFHPTVYEDEKKMLEVKKNGAYRLMDTECIQDGYKLDTEARLGKVSIGKVRKGKESIVDPQGDHTHTPKTKKKTSVEKDTYGEFNNVKLTDAEYQKLCQDFGDIKTHDAIKYLDEYIEEKGYKSKSHNLALRRWVFNAVDERKQKAAKDKPKGNDAWVDAFNSLKERHGGTNNDSK